LSLQQSTWLTTAPAKQSEIRKMSGGATPLLTAFMSAFASRTSCRV